MTRQNLIERLYELDTFTTKKSAAEALDLIIDVITETVASGDSIYLGKKFGRFSPKQLAPRTGVAPSGTTYNTPARKSIKFKPSTKLLASLV